MFWMVYFIYTYNYNYSFFLNYQLLNCFIIITSWPYQRDQIVSNTDKHKLTHIQLLSVGYDFCKLEWCKFRLCKFRNVTSHNSDLSHSRLQNFYVGWLFFRKINATTFNHVIMLMKNVSTEKHMISGVYSNF
jgi:lactate dehydrogenase-like 2-hydroxyacid dehydrogenase